MKRRVLYLLILLLSFFHTANAQQEENVWVIGNGAGLDFNTSLPIPISVASVGYNQSAMACNDSGTLILYTDGNSLYNRDQEELASILQYNQYLNNGLIPDGTTPWTIPGGSSYMLIARQPKQHERYYIFRIESGQLLYTVVDMSLDGGRGDIVPGSQNKYLSHLVMSEKLAVVKGCDKLWIVVRSKNYNEFRSYELNDTGLVTTPVYSNVGNLPLEYYDRGDMRASPDGRKIAAACRNSESYRDVSGGVELYDFDPHTGKLSNAIVLQKDSLLGYYAGVCFSPDNSKLYVTNAYAQRGVVSTGNSIYRETGLWQYDLTDPDSSAIINSETLIHQLPASYYAAQSFAGMKRGRDGKIYIIDVRPSVNLTLGGPAFYPSYFGFLPAPFFLHRIEHPNSPGLSCTFTLNAVNFSGNKVGGLFLPNDLGIYSYPDSVHHYELKTLCFADSYTIELDTGYGYHWQDGHTGSSYYVRETGLYTVGFMDLQCQYHTDSFYVRLVRFPRMGPPGYSCPEGESGMLSIHPYHLRDTFRFQYEWYDAAGNILRTRLSGSGDTLMGLNPGSYSVRISYEDYCDTTIYMEVYALPVPPASMETELLSCYGSEHVFVHMDSSLLWEWDLGDGTHSMEDTVRHVYEHPGMYEVKLLTYNLEGCRDSVEQTITVEDFKLTLATDVENRDGKYYISPYREVRLYTRGTHAYVTEYWEPKRYFLDQHKSSHYVKIDSTVWVIVKGVTPGGCEDMDSVFLELLVPVQVPSAFSPNGDGRNDRFRVLGQEGTYRIREMMVYNRWGELVYSGRGLEAERGWDGNYKGVPCDPGVYFYQINVELGYNDTQLLKGDVVLLR